METITTSNHWPLWRRLLFRFFFIYIALSIAPWTWLDNAPWISTVTNFFTKYYYSAVDWMVAKSNEWVFHVRPVLVPINGSGDTSYGWTLLWMNLSLAFIGMIVWSVIERKKKGYTKLNYWLCVFTRYFLALTLFSYGIIKLFSLQMPFPSYSQMATPLGDYLPMRLSWMFMGYSTPYQFFAGLMETVAGLLLLYRRTVTLGVLLGTAVLLNVAAMNLSYDIPVKIYSIQLVSYCLFLLANEAERILCFFVYNRPAHVCSVYHFNYNKKWMRVGRIVLKTIFILIAIGPVLWQSIGWKKEVQAEMSHMAFAPGLYDVKTFVVNRDTLSAFAGDSSRWQNIIFDNNHGGSLAGNDTAFYKIYHRRYFQYKMDTINHTISFLKRRMDTATFASLHYELVADSSIFFWGKWRNDSLKILVKRNPHQFQLAEKQFHWLSEYNR